MRARLTRLDYLLIAIHALLTLALATVWCKPAWSLSQFYQHSDKRRVTFWVPATVPWLADVLSVQTDVRWQTVVDGNNRVSFDLLYPQFVYPSYADWLDELTVELQIGLVGGARLYYVRRPIKGW